MRPMLASKGTFVPRGEEWVHEVKWDGVRALTEVRDGRLRMYSRNGNDITVAWPELSVSPLGERDLLVDGEIIALNEHGLPDFRMLQDRMHLRNAQSARRLSASNPATYMVFDLLRLDGEDLTRHAVGGAAGAARGARAGHHLAGARGVRRRADAVRGDPAAGPRGRGQQASLLDLRLRPPHRLLAQARAPAERLVRGRWLAAAGGLGRRQPRRRAGRGDDDRRPALPRPRRQRDRPEGRHPAGQAARGPRSRATAPSPTRCRRSTRSARTGSSPSWSSTSTVTRPPRTSACASRPTAASART